MANSKNEKSYKTGHRQRLRQRYIENGIDSLLEHEILEYLLFHSIPRIDTKPIAHKLIDEYGSLKNVLNASFESLKSSGLSDTSAALIGMYNDIGMWLRKNDAVGMKMADYNEAGRFLTQELDGLASETFVLLMLDSKNSIIGLERICEGGFRSTKVNMKKLLTPCLDKKACKVIVAHNHPSGDIRPSAEDHATTSTIENYLSGIEIELVEHYIIADGTYLGIKRNSRDVRTGIEMEYKNKFEFNKM